MLIAVKKLISSQPILIDSPLETTWVVCYLNHVTLVMGTCYRPPNCHDSFVKQLTDVIAYIESKFGAHILMAGDFTYPSINWLSSQSSNIHKTRECQDFIDMLSFFQIAQLIHLPTRGDSILDLLITTHADKVTATVLEQISVHRVIHCVVKGGRGK